MTDTPSSILLLRLQSTGSNVNLWGGYINVALQTLERASKGYEALAVTGDATISWTNYSASNSGAVAFLKLTGSTGGTLTFPAFQNFIDVWNANSQSVTIKCSGGTGVTLTTGQRALLFCDGVDYYNAGPTKFPTADVTFAGKLKGVTAGTDGTDATNLTQVNALIAAGAIPGAAGTVKVDAAATSVYLGAALTAGTDFTITDNGDSLALGTTPYWNTPRALAFADSPITALDRDVLILTTSGGAITVNLPASGRVWVVDKSGNAVTNNVTLVPSGADTITFGTLDIDYFGVVMRRTGTNWDLQ